MKGVVSIVCAVMLLMAGFSAFAHGTGQHVLGTVTAIDATHIEVKTPKGQSVSVRLTDKTRYKAKGKPKTMEAPSVGDRVVIEATKDGDVLTATEVHYSSAKQRAEADK